MSSFASEKNGSPLFHCNFLGFDPGIAPITCGAIRARGFAGGVEKVKLFVGILLDFGVLCSVGRKSVVFLQACNFDAEPGARLALARYRGFGAARAGLATEGLCSPSFPFLSPTPAFRRSRKTRFRHRKRGPPL
jgi:hypothetical protein